MVSSKRGFGKEKTKTQPRNSLSQQNKKQETKGVHIDRVPELWETHRVWSRFVAPSGGGAGGAEVELEALKGGEGEGEGKGEEGKGKQQQLRRRASGAA